MHPHELFICRVSRPVLRSVGALGRSRRNPEGKPDVSRGTARKLTRRQQTRSERPLELRTQKIPSVVFLDFQDGPFDTVGPVVPAHFRLPVT